MFQVDRAVFEDLVRQAVDELPEALRSQMANVAVVVQDHPTLADLDLARRRRGQAVTSLFGLYHGIPLPMRGISYDRVLPDLITLYQGTHEQVCGSLEELRDEVRITVRHEIAHHFGIDDARLDELGL